MYRQCRRGEVDLHVIAHRPADDLAAEEVDDGRQIQPTLSSRNVGDIGEPDPVRRCGGKVAIDEVRRDRQAMTAVGGPNPARRSHDGADTVPMHQAFDPATAGATSPHPQYGVDPWAAIAPAAILVDLSDISQKRGIGGRTCALRTLAPGIIAGRRDLEHGAHQPHRVGIAMVLDEAETHGRVPAKIAIDFSKNVPLHAQPLVFLTQTGDLGSLVRRSFSTQRRSTESRKPSSLPTAVIDRPLDTTSSAACRLYSSVNDRR